MPAKWVKHFFFVELVCVVNERQEAQEGLEGKDWGGVDGRGAGGLSERSGLITCDENETGETREWPVKQPGGVCVQVACCRRNG